MVTEYRHGIETVEVDDSLRPIELGPSNIIGVVGTAPDADEVLFPLNTPILIPGNARYALGIGTTGTIPDAIDGIFDQFGADVILIRVTEEDDVDTQLSMLIGSSVALTGVHALKKAKPILKMVPKLLIVPGYTAQRPADGVQRVNVGNGGQGYLQASVSAKIEGDGFNAAATAIVQNGSITTIIPTKKGYGFTEPPTVTIVDKAATAAKGALTLTANLTDGDTVTIGANVYQLQDVLTAVEGHVKIGATPADTVSNLIAAITAGAGSGVAYGAGTLAHPTVTAAADPDNPSSVVVTAKATDISGNAIATTSVAANAAFGAPTLTGGAGGYGATAVSVLGHVANPVVAEMLGIADDMRAIVIADLAGTTYEDAVAARGDYDSDRLWLVEGGIQVWDTENNVPIVVPVAPRLAGKQAYMDQKFGFWYSASNQPLNGVIGVNRIIDWSFTSSTVEGQLLNSQAIAVVVNEDGFRVLGTRSPTTKSNWKFLPVRRTADEVYDAIEQAMREAIDKPINLGLLDWIEGSVNAKLRELSNLGAIIDGRAWLDKSLNPVEDLQNGMLTIDFDIEPPAPLERLTFRAHRNAGYYTEVLDTFLRNAA